MLITHPRPIMGTRPAKRRVKIQPRDAASIQHVGEHRFLRSTDIRRLVGFPSERSCQQRLKELREGGYLQAIERRFGDYREGGGRNPYIHALGNKGAELLANRYKIWMSSRYTENNNAASDGYIDHDLGITDFMVAVELQCRDRGDVELIPFYEILERAPETTKQGRRHRQWPIVVGLGKTTQRRWLTPDKIFGLRDLNRPERRNQAYFFLEVDKSNETIDPIHKDLKGNTIWNKVLEYSSTFNNGVHRQYYNIGNFRVLFVTTSQTRVKNFITMYQKHATTFKTPSSVFLFTDETELDRHGRDILSVRWTNGRGERVTLLD